MKFVLLDVDDTLFDFLESAKSAIKKCCEIHEVEYSDYLIERFIALDRELWHKYEIGEIEQKEIFEKRFLHLFEEFNIDKDPILFEENFKNFLASEYVLIDGAKELVEYLSEKYDVYVASNSVAEVQLRRIKASGFDKYFKDIFVSDTIQAQKPSRKFFEGCFERIENFDKSRTIIIGDSLASDMQGGYNSGIKTCWFNPYKKENTLCINCDYEICSLEEVKNIL